MSVKCRLFGGSGFHLNPGRLPSWESGRLKANTWVEIKPPNQKLSQFLLLVFASHSFFVCLFSPFFKCAACLLKHIGMPAFAYVALSSNKKKQGLAVAFSCCPFQLCLLNEQYYICLRSDPYLWRWKNYITPSAVQGSRLIALRACSSSRLANRGKSCWWSLCLPYGERRRVSRPSSSPDFCPMTSVYSCWRSGVLWSANHKPQSMCMC